MIVMLSKRSSKTKLRGQCYDFGNIFAANVGEKFWRKFQTFKQGCQMFYFKAKNHILGTFWRVLQWKMLVYLMVSWSI
jgi:hypothetical protein